MVRLLPVRAWHPDPAFGDPSALVAPVYDTLGPEEHRRFGERPHNAATFTSRPQDRPVGDFLDTATRALEGALRAGAYVQDPRPSLYVYAIRYRPPPDILEALPETQRRPSYLLLGLVGALPEDAGTSEQVALHERTFPERVDERVRLTQRTGSHFAPIVVGYRPRDHAINDLLEAHLGIDRRALAFEPKVPPLFTATLDGTAHSLWRLEDPALVEELARRLLPERVLVLDGHHRFTAASTLQRQGNPVRPLTMLVEERDKALLLLPWHRVLAPALLTFPRLRSELRQLPWTVLERPAPARAADAVEQLARLGRSGERGFLAVSAEGGLEVRAGRSEHEGDAYELLEELLRARMGLDPARFGFVASPHLALRQAREEGGVAFLLPPLSIEGVEREAFAHRCMAQKSTMFLPKVAEGVLFAPARQA